MKVFKKQLTAKDVVNFFVDNLLYFAIAALTIYVAIRQPNFLNAAPLNILNRTAAYVIMALGMGCIMLIGVGADLSAGRIMGFTSIISTVLLLNPNYYDHIFPGFGLPIPAVILLVIVIGALISGISGFFAAKFKLSIFIVTLSTQIVLYATMLNLINVNYKYFYNNISLLLDEYRVLITNTVQIGGWSIPNYVWYAIAIVIIMWVFWEFIPLGKKMRLYGQNHEAAKTLNINSVAITVVVFTIVGAMYGLNGFIEAARVGGTGGSLSVGANAELDAIAACLIGGVSMKGGIGKIGGIVIGVILLQLIFVCLQWLSVSANYVYMIKGVIVLWAATMDARKNYAGSEPAV